eukprot:gene2813-biopygen2052
MRPGHVGPPPATRRPRAAAPHRRRRPARKPCPWAGQEGPAAGSGRVGPPAKRPHGGGTLGLPTIPPMASDRSTRPYGPKLPITLTLTVTPRSQCFGSPSEQPLWMAFATSAGSLRSSFRGSPVYKRGSFTISPSIPVPQITFSTRFCSPNRIHPLRECCSSMRPEHSWQGLDD